MECVPWCELLKMGEFSLTESNIRKTGYQIQFRNEKNMLELILVELNFFSLVSSAKPVCF